MGNKPPKSAQVAFGPIELEMLGDQFNVLSKKSGTPGEYISPKIFKHYFLKEYPTLSQRLYVVFDLDRDGKIGFSDFFEGMVRCLRGKEEDRVRFIFKMFAPTGRANILELKAEFPEHIRRRELAKAVYPFEGQAPKELSFQQGAILIVLNKKHDVWWWAQHKETLKKGYIPKDYITILPPERVGIEQYENNGFITEREFVKWAPTCPALQNFVMMLQSFELRPPPEFEITGPSGFVHATHVGYDPLTGGFETKSLPPEWQKLLGKAGITAEQAADPSTAKFITQVLSQTLEKAGTGQDISSLLPDTLPSENQPNLAATPLIPATPPPSEPVIPATGPPAEPVIPATGPPTQPVIPATPPPAGPAIPSTVPPPEPFIPATGPPEPVIPSTGPPSEPVIPATGPPSASVIQSGGAPMPPPMPAPQLKVGGGTLPPPPLPSSKTSSSTAPTTGDFLSDIRKGMALKKVDPSMIDLQKQEVPMDDLASILRRAMAARNFDIEEDHTKWDNDDTEWSE